MNAVALLALSAISYSAMPAGIVYDFSATWCGPCQQMSPIVSRLEREGLPIRKVDVDQERALAQQFGIRSIPAFVLVINGKVEGRITGATTEYELRQLISRIPARPPEVLTAQQQDAPRERTFATEPAQPRAARQDAVSFEPQPDPKFSQPVVSRSKPKPRPTDVREAVIRANLDDRSEVALGELRNDPLAASTRIRIQDKTGVNFGSGTIIESRVGKTIILTCGHIFRDFKPDSLVEVDVFVNGRAETFVGKPVGYDFEADVGLISIPTSSVMPCAKIAPAGFRVASGAQVQSVGCGGGEVPTRQDLKVTALNRYRGPDNIECTGVPVQGRSGGGLFTKDGMVIGVCTAADPRDRRGLYAGTKAIHNLLKDRQLAHLYQRKAGGEVEETQVASDAPLFNGGRSRLASRDRLPTDDEVEAARAAALARRAGSRPAMDFRDSADSDEDRFAPSAESLQAVQDAFRDAGDAEVICVIRPLKDSQAASRVVVLNRASRQFVASLNDEVDAQSERKKTSLKVTRKPASDHRQQPR